MPNHPLAEVFGFPPDELSEEVERYRRSKLCPYHNKVPSCTKDKANNPLGVCSIHDGGEVTITCPIRFRQDWLIAEDAANFLFTPGTAWTSLQEVRLNSADGKSAGNIDFVLVAYDDTGKITDFGSLEVQAVYISGNVRQPFEHYMSDRENRREMIWTSTNVRADYLSSSRKRLVPQMLYKGSICKTWRKKQAVALHRGFYNTLPVLPEVAEEDADVAWLVYDLELKKSQNRYQLVHYNTVYTQFGAALEKITTPKTGSVDDFIIKLQEKLGEQLDNQYSPDAPTLTDILKSE